MAQKSKFVEERINKLLVSNEDHLEKEDFKSPILKKLHNNQNENVRKLRNIFEAGKVSVNHNSSNSSPDSIGNEDCIKSTRRKPISPSNTTAKFFNRARQSFDCLRGLSPKASQKTSINKTEKIIDELIAKEREYIETLERGIENYVRLIENVNDDDNAIEIPQQIRHEKFKLFINIEEIVLLHKLVILPEIISCNNDAEILAKFFVRLTENDIFYPYIVYAICYINAKAMAVNYSDFFCTVQNLVNDPLGVFSFILQPIQKLTRYPLIIEEIIKDLSREMHENKNTLASLCIAKKKLERYLERMNQSLKLNDIVEAHQLPIKLQYGVLTSLQIEFGVDVNEPTFLIVPTFSNFAEYQPPFNVFDLGKFIKTESMECHEQLPIYRFYYAELFIFEKCLLYTKKFENGDGKSLLYRDKFLFGPQITIELKQDERALTIVEGSRMVSFASQTFEQILKFNDLIRRFYDPRKSSDSAFFDEHFVARPVMITTDSFAQNEAQKKDRTSCCFKEKSINDAKNNAKTDHDDDEDERGSFVDAISDYEYDNFKSDSDNDPQEEDDFIKFLNSQFYVQSD